ASRERFQGRRLDRIELGRQFAVVVGRKTVREQVAERAGGRFIGLERSGQRLGKRAPGALQLVRRKWRRRDSLQFGKHFLDGWGGDIAAHRSANRERRRHVAVTEARPNAVGVALVFAQVEVETAAKRATERF